MGISAVSNLNLYGIYKAPKVPQNKLCGNYGLVNRNLQSDTVSFGANTNNAKKAIVKSLMRINQYGKSKFNNGQIKNIVNNVDSNMLDKAAELAKCPQFDDKKIIEALKRFGNCKTKDGTTVDKTKELLLLAKARRNPKTINYSDIFDAAEPIVNNREIPGRMQLRILSASKKIDIDKLNNCINKMLQKSNSSELKKLKEAVDNALTQPIFNYDNIYEFGKIPAEKLTKENIEKSIGLYRNYPKVFENYEYIMARKLCRFIKKLPEKTEDNTKLWEQAWEEAYKKAKAGNLNWDC